MPREPGISAVYLLGHSGSTGTAICQLSHSNWSHAIPLLHTYTYEYAEFGRTLPVEPTHAPCARCKGRREGLVQSEKKHARQLALALRLVTSKTVERTRNQEPRKKTPPESFFSCWVCSRDYRLAGKLGVMLGLGIGMS